MPDTFGDQTAQLSGGSVYGSAQLGAAGSIPAPVLGPQRIPVTRVMRAGSPKYEFVNGSSRCVAEYNVSWDTTSNSAYGPNWFFDAVRDALGFPVLQAGSYISRYLPDWVPILSYNSGLYAPSPFLWCTRASIEGLDAVTDTNQDAYGWFRYKNAKLTCIYETLPYALVPDSEMALSGDGGLDESSLQRFVVKNPQPQVSYQSLPTGSLYYVTPDSKDGKTTVPGTPGKLEVKANFSLKWMQVPEMAVPYRLVNPLIANFIGGDSTMPVVDAISDCMGCLNLYPLAGCAKGTLLLTAAVLTRYQSFQGDWLWDVEYLFSYFPVESSMKLTAANAANDYVYGHVLLLRQDAKLDDGSRGIAYDEAISKSATDTNKPTSNYLLDPPPDGVNIFNFRDFAALFRVPPLLITNPG